MPDMTILRCSPKIPPGFRPMINHKWEGSARSGLDRPGYRSNKLAFVPSGQTALQRPTPLGTGGMTSDYIAVLIQEIHILACRLGVLWLSLGFKYGLRRM